MNRMSGKTITYVYCVTEHFISFENVILNCPQKFSGSGTESR